MRYWDSSAVLPLLYPEISSEGMEGLYAQDPAVASWLLTPVEVHSALFRRRREGAEPEILQKARRRFTALRQSWFEVADVAAARDRAIRLMETHALTAADSLQLTAALLAADERPAGLGFVTLDAAFADVARREGFEVLPLP